MVEEILIDDWESVTSGKYPLYKIRLESESDLREIAETLNLPFIFKKKNELICGDGRILYWYKP